MVVRRLGIVVGMCSVFWASAALAAEPARDSGDPRPARQAPIGQEHFALGPQLGFYNPNGLALRGGFRWASLELAAGFMPTLLSYGGDRDPNLKLIAPFQVSPQLVLADIPFENRIRGAFRVGYRYDLALGHGGTIGAQLSKRWGHVQLEGLWGVSLFPHGERNLRQDEVVPSRPQFNSTPDWTWGLTVGLMYYP